MKSVKETAGKEVHFGPQRKAELPAVSEIYKASLKAGLAPLQLAEAHELLMKMPENEEDVDSDIGLDQPQASQCKAVVIAIIVICIVFASIAFSAFISLRTGIATMSSTSPTENCTVVSEKNETIC
ncbi:Oidioi.mRNA.OKI2018_I69.PAR.g12765.t1.cds [Oikopleura dioica]|uniref:Oidioi.mRNA.OKI2018_I69.PAR.g12765.t1.cds n=1 Tax=Oikopleura dioica TaxID=34765 RepID=A0ABN7S1J6_OIKDI|nr:Oidioi.mRNA.OKI2018_I69.PAR.g12765.t1.cds [Oikopleura dioica]